MRKSLQLLALVSGSLLFMMCALLMTLWLATYGERELKRQMGLIRHELKSCSTEFHWAESGRITVVVIGMADAAEQDKAVQWITEQKATGLFERFHQIEFFEQQSWDRPRKLIRRVALE